MSKVEAHLHDYRATGAMRTAVAASAALFVGAFALCALEFGAAPLTLLFGGLAVFGIVGVADVTTLRVQLDRDGLLLTSNLRSRRIPRESIREVTWERSSGVALKLDSGALVHLPDTGHAGQTVAREVRSWVRSQSSRQEPPPP